MKFPATEEEIEQQKQAIRAQIQRLKQAYDQAVLQTARKPTEKRLLYNIEGRVGEVKLPEDGLIDVNHLFDNLKEPPAPRPDKTKDQEDKLREQRHQSMNVKTYGQTQFWAPDCTTVIGNNRLSSLMKQTYVKEKLDQFFNKEKCTLNEDSMLILTAFAAFNYGGSDEAFEMAIAGSWKALLNQIGYEVDSVKVRSLFSYSKLQFCCKFQTNYDFHVFKAWKVHTEPEDSSSI